MNPKFIWRLFSPIIIALFLISITANAQQSIDSATLTGHVEDQTGAVILNAKITAINTEKNLSWTATTDGQGAYRLLYLPVGNYQLKVEATSFASQVRPIILSVGQTVDLTFQLLVPQATDRPLFVTDEPSVVESVRTQISETVRPKEIDNLPLNGRNYLDLAALTPGVTRGNPVANQRFAETSAVPGTQLNMAGQRNINNGFVIDGLSANDDAADLPGSYFSHEVIGEFQVITSGGIAEFGRASGGIVNVVTKSGSNDWHGRAYGFLSNQRANARNPLATTKDPYTQTQYGTSLGGPLKRDRTFWFGNFEQTRLHNATVVTILPANVTAINAALDALKFTGLRAETGLIATGYNTSNIFLRGDHRLNENNLLTARYSFYDITSGNARGVGGLSAPSRGTSLKNRDQTFAVSEVATFGANTANEARFQFTHSNLSAPANDLTGPAITISGVANLGTSTSSPTGRNNNMFEFADSVTTRKAAHSFKVGADFLYNRVNILFPGALQGAYTFSSVANLQAGRYVTYQQAFGVPSLFQSNPNLGFFAQDEWRVRQNLTVNFGVRYDLQFLPNPINTDKNNFAPRLGIVYAPRDHKTVIRASYGIYYDRIPLRATSNAIQRDGTKYKVASFSFGQAGAPVFPSVATTFPTGFLPSITSIDPKIGNAYSQQANLQIERELSSNTSLSVGYLNTRGLHIILSRNVNVPTLTAAQATAQNIANLGRPNPNFGNISRYESSGNSYYNGLLVSLNHRLKGWLGGRLSYTYSKAIDTTGSAFFFTPQDNANLRDELGRSDNDQRQVLAVSATLVVPEASRNNAWKRVFTGFQLSPIFRYGSALPFNILLGSDRNNDTSVNDRPVGVSRNTGIGFNFASFDARLSRRIHFTERVGIEILAEGFNLFNRANLQLPNATIGTGTTPLVTFRTPTGAADPRQVQIGLRLNY